MTAILSTMAMWFLHFLQYLVVSPGLRSGTGRGRDEGLDVNLSGRPKSNGDRNDIYPIYFVSDAERNFR